MNFKMLIAICLLMASACSKKENEKSPQSITVTAKAASFMSMPTEIAPRTATIVFDYNGTQKRVTFNRVDEGSQNGSVRISNTDIVSASPVFMSPAPGPESVGITNATVPNEIVVTIDNFTTTYVSDNYDFNKLTLVFDANTKFYLNGQTVFSTYDASTLNVFRANVQKIAGMHNDCQPGTAGDQPLPVKAYVQNF